MAKRYAVLDSGKREEFSSGAKRDIREGKGRFDLCSPFALRRWACVNEGGAIKYGDRNHESGMPMTRYLDSALRHINQAIEGKQDEDHLAQALWNLAGAIHTEESVERGLVDPKFNDMPCYLPKTKGKGRK